MAKKKNKFPFGKWAFLVGLIIAILAAFITAYTSIVIFVLFVLGLVVGFMNIADRDVSRFLIAIIALMLFVGSLSAISVLGTFGVTLEGYLSAILMNFVAFVGAAGLVVSIKAIFQTSK